MNESFRRNAAAEDSEKLAETDRHILDPRRTTCTSTLPRTRRTKDTSQRTSPGQRGDLIAAPVVIEFSREPEAEVKPHQP
jgi:hypothetical protein